MDLINEHLSRRRLLALAGSGVAGLALSACGFSAKTTMVGTSSAPGLAGGRKVTIRTCVYAKNHAASMLFWQRFAPVGVTVSVVPVTTTAEVMQGLEGANLDMAGVALSNGHASRVST